MPRATSLGPHEIFLLDQWGRQLWEAFRETPYLVGSVARGAEHWRDVDVRLLLPKGASWVTRTEGRLRSINLAISLWGRHVTGLPVDFQFQAPDEFHEHDTERRNPLGTRSRHVWSQGGD